MTDTARSFLLTFCDIFILYQTIQASGMRHNINCMGSHTIVDRSAEVTTSVKFSTRPTKNGTIAMTLMSVEQAIPAHPAAQLTFFSTL